MGAIGRDVAYPSIEQIVDVNRQMNEASGGLFTPPDNLANRSSLEFILEAIADPVYSQLRFPSLKEKAAVLAGQIIIAHVFNEGNKRTGVHMAWEFLEANSVSVSLDDSILDLTERLAAGEAETTELLEWLHLHQP